MNVTQELIAAHLVAGRMRPGDEIGLRGRSARTIACAFPLVQTVAKACMLASCRARGRSMSKTALH
jgi:hypothetical protein